VQDRIILSREVEAIQIPSGDSITLPANTEVFVTQKLGGSYTVATSSGLARVTPEDADALGIEADTGDPAADPSGLAPDAPLEDRVWDQLKNVYDPEIPVDIVNLGLIYDCSISNEGDETVVAVKMTLTAPGCGMGPVIAADAQSRIMTLEEVDDARVELVWDPPWNQEMISEEGRMKLGMV